MNEIVAEVQVTVNEVPPTGGIFHAAKRTFRCPKGHTYTNICSFDFRVSFGTEEQSSGPICPYCVMHFLREHFATSEIVPEDSEKPCES